jgi:hypothetical protein
MDTVLSILTKLFPAFLRLAKDIADARKKTSDGGKKITRKEAHKIADNVLKGLLPDCVDVILASDDAADEG